MDRARLPAGAVVQIGVARYTSADVLGKLSMRADGTIFGAGFTYARLWDADGFPVWTARTRGETLLAAAADSADVVALVERGRCHPSYTSATLSIIDPSTAAVRQTSPLGHVAGLDISPRGRYVLLLGTTVSVVDVATGASVMTPKATVARAGRVDDAHAAVLVVGEQVVTWSGVNGEAPQPVAQLPRAPLLAAFSRGGTHVAWSSGDRVGVLEIATGTSVMEVPWSGTTAATLDTLAIAADGARIAIGTKGQLEVWDVARGAVAWACAVEHRAAATFSADGEVIIGDGFSILRYAADGMPRTRPENARFVGFAATGGLLIDIGKRHTGFDLANLKEIAPEPAEKEPVPPDAPEWADRACVARDGSVVAWNGDEDTQGGAVRVWRSDGVVWKTPKPRDCTVFTPWVFGPGMIADTSAADAIIYHCTTERAVLTLEAGRRTLSRLVASPDLDLVIAVWVRELHAADDHELRNEHFPAERTTPGFDVEVWSCATGKLVSAADLPAERFGVADAIVRRDGQVAYLGWHDGTVDELALPGGAVRTLGRQPTGIVFILQSPTTQHIATMDADGRTMIWSP